MEHCSRQQWEGRLGTAAALVSRGTIDPSSDIVKIISLRLLGVGCANQLENSNACVHPQVPTGITHSAFVASPPPPCVPQAQHTGCPHSIALPSAGETPARLRASRYSNPVTPDDSAPDFPDLVLDGLDRREDVDWQRSTRRLAATWTPATDAQSGLADPPTVVCFGTAAGTCDTSDGFHPAEFAHMHTFEAATQLGPGPYFATVRTTNRVGMSTDRYSDGVGVDPDPPVFGAGASVRVTGTSGGTTSRALAVEWDAASDAASRVVGYHVAVGLRAGTSGLVEYFDVGPVTAATLTLPPHVPAYRFYMTVRARDATGLHAYLSSGPVTYDATPPKLTRIRVSRTAASGDAFAPQVTPRVSAHDFYAFLDNAADPETGIARVRWWLRAQASAPVTTPEVLSSWESGWRMQGLAVASGPYRLVVELQNGAGATAQYETPLHVVGAGPSAGQIWDGLGTVDQQHVPVGRPVGATWSGIGDPDAIITGRSHALTHGGVPDRCGFC